MVAFKCLAYMLPSRAVKGVKRPRITGAAAVDYFFVDYEVISIFLFYILWLSY